MDGKLFAQTHCGFTYCDELTRAGSCSFRRRRRKNAYFI